MKRQFTQGALYLERDSLRRGGQNELRLQPRLAGLDGRQLPRSLDEDIPAELLIDQIIPNGFSQNGMLQLGEKLFPRRQHVVIVQMVSA